ncbi:MAG: VanZ family protein [Verrucomicrobia bacterium]|nr:VanZ family protein [Verrucomicrobiota bacterium]
MAKNWIYWAATAPSGVLRRIWWLTCTAAIAIASLIPSSDLPSVAFKYDDKFIHFAIYALYALAFCWAWPQHVGRRAKPLAGVIGACVLYGLLMETLQGSLPTLQREFSWADVAANTLGAMAGSWLWFRAATRTGSRSVTGG